MEDDNIIENEQLVAETFSNYFVDTIINLDIKGYNDNFIPEMILL